jgi:hypothetical protein
MQHKIPFHHFPIFILLVVASMMACNTTSTDQPTTASDQQSLKPHFGESETDYYLANPIAGHLHQPNANRTFSWSEHPSGKMVQQTNNLGFREDEATSEQKSANEIRILVTGDSHTDGVVYNKESFPNQIEVMLNTDSTSTQLYNFLNAGAGYYGPQNYLGVLQHYLYLKPDVFLVNLYTGNDFLDAIRIAAENGRLAVPERKNDYYEGLWQVDELYPGFTGQLMNQIKFFTTFPKFKVTALNITEQHLLAIDSVCKQNNIRLILSFLPTKVDIEPYTDSSRIKEVQGILGFSDTDLLLNQQLTQELIARLDKRQIKSIRLAEKMLSEGSMEYYWKQDYHLNHHGHRRVAEIVNEAVTNWR